MSSPKLWALIRILIEKTAKGQIEWKKAEAETDTFTASFPTSSVSVTRWEEGRPDGPMMRIRLKLFDQDGTVVDDGENLTKFTATPATEEEAKMLREIFDLARSRALNADATIDNLVLLLNNPLRIVNAAYGAAGKQVDITQPLTRLIDKNGVLNVKISNALAGDPAHGAEKEATVRYTYGQQEKVVKVKEGDVLRLP